MNRTKATVAAVTALLFAGAGMLATVTMVQRSFDDAERLEAKDRVAAADRRNASRERAELLKGQERLDARYRDLAAQYASLLEWLQGEGISVPPALVDLDPSTNGAFVPRRQLRSISSESGSGDTSGSTAQPRRDSPGRSSGSSPRTDGGGGPSNGAPKSRASSRGDSESRPTEDSGRRASRGSQGAGPGSKGSPNNDSVKGAR